MPFKQKVAARNTIERDNRAAYLNAIYVVNATSHWFAQYIFAVLTSLFSLNHNFFLAMTKLDD
jgi:hypothetical protein